MGNRLTRGAFAAALVTGLFGGGATGQEAAGKAPHDERHDFELGSWKMDLKRRQRRLRPLTSRLDC